MTTTLPTPTQTDRIRASDADRETALALLRAHWIAGRLTLEEYEQRCDEATTGRFLDALRHAVRELPYPLPDDGPPPSAAPAAEPARRSGAVLSLVLGVLSLGVAVISFGMLFLVTLPVSTWAWQLGRRVRRASQPDMPADVRAVASVGEVLGIVATVIGCMALTACGLIIVAA
ncbi:MAG TPA: DUF1707 domain-containing protein [Solirubrobacteraceae bacterium]|nr:DUF1707 domain-containing protein [Solirubrobacteraceae bacterium]